jgi:hypothetical protein
MLDLSKPVTVEGCKVSRIANQLDATDRAVFLEAIRDAATWSSYRLELELKARGIRVSNDTIMTHRRGVCSCQS